mgnify:CR=1 FL=1|jgi:hypothetical protein|tara:strand:+ start:267 stop:386 length:120 start_codon:yes stop_codon:yes gene_type:complete
MAGLTGYWKEKESKYKKVLSKRQKARIARKIEENRYKKK